MLIRIDSLEEGCSYKVEKHISASPAIVDIIGASVVDKIKLTLHYTWASDRLSLDICANYRIDAHCDLCFGNTVADCNCTMSEELSQEDSEYSKANNAFDISKLIEECIIFAVARKVRCSDDCKGICSTCGKNLNMGNCKCDKSDNTNPFGILKELINTGGAKNGSTKKKNI